MDVHRRGVFKNSSLNMALENSSIIFPDAEPLPGKCDPVPFMIVGDNALPLKHYLLKPYSQIGLTKQKRIYDYISAESCQNDG